jgi:hypothetical protein
LGMGPVSSSRQRERRAGPQGAVPLFRRAGGQKHSTALYPLSHASYASFASLMGPRSGRNPCPVAEARELPLGGTPRWAPEPSWSVWPKPQWFGPFHSSKLEKPACSGVATSRPRARELGPVAPGWRWRPFSADWHRGGRRRAQRVARRTGVRGRAEHGNDAERTSGWAYLL